MRKLILNVAVSLDGRIEGPNGEYDWCYTDQDYGMTTFLEGIDTLFLGRKSYDLYRTMKPDPFAKCTKIVFSKSVNQDTEEVKWVSGDIKNRVRAIKSEKGKDIWLFGGAELTRTLLNMNLVDELQMAVHPLILGKGKLMFDNLLQRVHLNLFKSIKYSSGLIQLFYSVSTETPIE